MSKKSKPEIRKIVIKAINKVMNTDHSHKITFKLSKLKKEYNMNLMEIAEMHFKIEEQLGKELPDTEEMDKIVAVAKKIEDVINLHFKNQ